MLCLVDCLARKNEFDSIRVAGRGVEMGLVCLLATLLDPRIAAAGIDGMVSSFVQLVGHGNPASQIPGSCAWRMWRTSSTPPAQTACSSTT